MATCLYFSYIYDPKTNREANLAGDGVSRYLIQELEKIFDKIYVVNLEQVAKNFSFQLETKQILSEKTILINPAAIKFSRIENKIFWKRKLHTLIKKYIKEYAKNCDIVFAYHSLVSTNILSKLKSKYHYKLIIQIEEIYSEIYKQFAKFNQVEMKSLICGDGYIVANNKLKTKFDIVSHKICPILLGDMRMPTLLSNKICDGRIHLVYGGTLAKNKISFDQLILALAELDKRYVLHIFPSNNQAELTDYLSAIDKDISKRVIVEKPVFGEQYFAEISKYHIGLAININSPELASSAIPSKIINYLKCNLNVVSTPLECVKQSAYGNYIVLANGFSQENIAAAIETCASKSIQNSNVMEGLIAEFRLNLKTLIRQVSDRTTGQKC